MEKLTSSVLISYFRSPASSGYNYKIRLQELTTRDQRREMRKGTTTSMEAEHLRFYLFLVAEPVNPNQTRSNGITLREVDRKIIVCNSPESVLLNDEWICWWKLACFSGAIRQFFKRSGFNTS